MQLSSEAINLFLNALDLDIESAQEANEAVVRFQLERGKFDQARSFAENARGQSLRYDASFSELPLPTTCHVSNRPQRFTARCLLLLHF